MPGPDTEQVPAITEPEEDPGSKNSGQSRVTRSIAKAAKAGLNDNPNDHSILESESPLGQRERGRRKNKQRNSLENSKSKSSASKGKSKKSLALSRPDTSDSRSRSNNSARRPQRSPNVAKKAAIFEDPGNKRKQVGSTPAKSPAAKRISSTQRPIIMAGDEDIPPVPPHDAPD